MRGMTLFFFAIATLFLGVIALGSLPGVASVISLYFPGLNGSAAIRTLAYAIIAMSLAIAAIFVVAAFVAEDRKKEP